MPDSLFWKIFVTLLTANGLVAVSTICLLMPTGDKEIYEFAINLPKTVIRRIDTGKSMQLFQSEQSESSKPMPDYFMLERILILNDQNKVIFGEENLQINHWDFFLDHQNNYGRQYQVSINIPENNSLFAYFSSPRRTAHFLIIFFFTALASFFLSLVIIQPLKKLKKHAQSLSGGNMQPHLEENLLKRGDEIGDLSREFGEMANALNKLINSKQQLLHDVSHELRAPLSRLQAISAILQQYPNASKQKMIKRIERECVCMNELIQEILDYSRMHYDQENKQTASPVNLSAFFRKLVEGIQLEFPTHLIQLDHIDAQLAIASHTKTLSRAFENILRNACKHTPGNSLVSICAQRINKHVEIQIRDHGPGVDDTELAKLTRPFYRANVRKNTEGSGLGLSISRRIISQYQGNMKIRNHPQGGLLISVIFPIETTINN